MRRFKILLISGVCVLGLAISACGQTSNKKPGTFPSSDLGTGITYNPATNSNADSVKKGNEALLLKFAPGHSVNNSQGYYDSYAVSGYITGSAETSVGTDITSAPSVMEGTDITKTPTAAGETNTSEKDANLTGNAEVTDVAETAQTPDPTNKIKATETPNPTNMVTPSEKITEVSKTMYASTQLDVRTDNNSSSESIGVINVNESVNVTGICDNGWARIDYMGTTAYVGYNYLADSKVSTATPKPATATPRPVTATPKPATATPKPATATPKPATATPKPATATPKPATPTSLPQSGGTVPVNTSHGTHTFNASYHNDGQSYYTQNLDIIQAHLKCVNDLRASVGASPLTLDVTVSKIASYRTAEMINLGFFSHYHNADDNASACYTDVVYFYQNGYSGIAENITYISGNWSFFWNRTGLAEELFNRFKNSSGHYANMISKDYTKIGICVYESSTYVLLTQVFE